MGSFSDLRKIMDMGSLSDGNIKDYFDSKKFTQGIGMKYIHSKLMDMQHQQRTFAYEYQFDLEDVINFTSGFKIEPSEQQRMLDILGISKEDIENYLEETLAKEKELFESYMKELGLEHEFTLTKEDLDFRDLPKRKINVLDMNKSLYYSIFEKFDDHFNYNYYIGGSSDFEDESQIWLHLRRLTELSINEMVEKSNGEFTKKQIIDLEYSMYSPDMGKIEVNREKYFALLKSILVENYAIFSGLEFIDCGYKFLVVGLPLKFESHVDIPYPFNQTFQKIKIHGEEYLSGRFSFLAK